MVVDGACPRTLPEYIMAGHVQKSKFLAWIVLEYLLVLFQSLLAPDSLVELTDLNFHPCLHHHFHAMLVHDKVTDFMLSICADPQG